MSPGSGVRSESPIGPRKVSCVLWTPRGTLPPRELEVELSKKGITHRSSDNSHGAMAMLAGWAREHAEGRGAVRVLILVEPSRLDGVHALLNALDRYTPDAVRWVYKSGANPALRAFVEEDVTTTVDSPSASTPASSHPFRAVGTPRAERRPMPLRLVDAPAAPLLREARPAEPPEADGERGLPEGSRLTDEELAMLLGDDPPSGDVGPARGSGLGR